MPRTSDGGSASAAAIGSLGRDDAAFDTRSRTEFEAGRRHLHRTVLARLALVWVALSLVLGTGAFFQEMRETDALMLRIATERSKDFIEHAGRVEFADTAHLEALRRSAEETLKYGFASVRVYDASQRLVLETVDARPGGNRPDPGRHVHSLRPGEVTHYHTRWAGARPYMQLLLPIERQRELLGYFEGVYQVDAATAQAMIRLIAGAVGLVVAVAFATAAVLYPVIIFLNRGLAERSAALLRSNLELMEVLGSAVAKRDSDTHLHNFRVTLYAVRLAQSLALPESDVRRLIAGAFLHDVGKIGIGDDILRKPGPLSAEELAVMRTHVALGVDIISEAAWLQSARDVVACHHERFDGSGYPQGLSGDSIPLNARIFAVADVFDAMTSRRCYKEPLTLEEARAFIRRGSGSLFDPRVAAAFDAIAADLHRETRGADEKQLRAALRSLVARYFLQAGAIGRD